MSVTLSLSLAVSLAADIAAIAATVTLAGRCCRPRLAHDSLCESMGLEWQYDMPFGRPLPHNELV